MDPPAYVRQGAVNLLHAFQVSLSCWPHAAPPPADDMLAVEIALRDALAVWSARLSSAQAAASRMASG